MKSRPVYRTSTIFPVFRDHDLRTHIEFLNYWPIIGIDRIGGVCSLRDGQGVLLDRVVFDLNEVRGYSVDCNSILDTVGIDGPFLGSLEFEGFSGQNLRVATPALMGVYRSTDHQAMLHAYTRTYNDLEEEQYLHTLFQGDNFGWPIFDDIENESYFVLLNGNKEVDEQDVMVELYNSAGDRLNIVHHVEKLPPYGCRQFTAGGTGDVVDFLKGEPGWMVVYVATQGALPIIMGGVRQRNGSKMSTSHGYSFFKGRDIFLPQNSVQNGNAPYHLPVSIVPSDLSPKIFLYPNIGDTSISLDVHLYDADGGHIYGEQDYVRLIGGGTRMTIIDCHEWTDRFPDVAIVDFVANAIDVDRIPSRLHCSILYGEPGLDVCLAEVFKFYTDDSKETRMRWGIVDQSQNRKTYISLRNVNYDPEYSGRVDVQIELCRGSDSKRLQRSLTIPSNGSITESADNLFSGAEEFLSGQTGWYFIKNAPRSIKTMSVIEDQDTKATSGEHGF